jgi:hypothetical protein
VEEAAAAAKGMEHQSQQLITEVSYFRTEDSNATEHDLGLAHRSFSAVGSDTNMPLSRAA